ncbi:hypothetical protein EVAR_16456_1 [Eumeta japonica]|uniref:Reverse transcriptase domain-containing protein n=1 Tax=Eumeta variegata TaxID=151549 RepID=A0A4C1ULM5_EUMVA|nr:hypothetical protein EVAR_16456_1 [Eumeta japonica]
MDTKSTFGPPSGTRVYNTAKTRWFEFGAAIDGSLTERALIVEVVKSVGSNLERRLKLPWWSAELEGLKRDARTKKRRIRNAALSRREHVVREYIKAKEFYEKAAAEESGEKPRGFLTPNRLLDESVTLLAETFFSDDRVDTDDLHYTAIRRRTDGDDQPPVTSGDLPGVDSPFIGAKVKNALKTFHHRKAPSIDGFTLDIYQAAIFRDLELFLALANKCLEWGFLRAWKVSVINVIPKLSKDNYAPSLPYRLINLFLVLGKTVKIMLLGRFQWHLLPKMQETQFGFTTQHGTKDALHDLTTCTLVLQHQLNQQHHNYVIQ